MVDGNGGMLVCKTPKEEKYNFVTGTKGYLWQESHVVEGVKELQKYIDFSYFEKLADEARKTLEEFGSFEAFVKED